MQEIILSKMQEWEIPLIYRELHLKYVEKYEKSQQKEAKRAYSQWYTFMLQSPLYTMYTAKTHEGEFIAHIRFENKGKDAIISIFIDEKFRGKRYSYPIIEQAVNRFSKEKKVRKILAYILKENEISQHVFQKSGFVYEKNGNYNGMRHMLFVKKVDEI